LNRLAGARRVVVPVPERREPSRRGLLKGAHFMPEAGSEQQAAVDGPQERQVAQDMLREVTATRYVEPLRSGGSVPGVVEADDLGTYVVKLST
jgi:hypothetical protein